MKVDYYDSFDDMLSFKSRLVFCVPRSCWMISSAIDVYQDQSVINLCTVLHQSLYQRVYNEEVFSTFSGVSQLMLLYTGNVYMCFISDRVLSLSLVHSICVCVFSW